MDLNKNENVLLLGVGALILYPLIKGLMNISETAGNILSLPGDLVRKIGDSAVRQVHDAGYQLILNYVSYHIYNENDIRDQLDMKRLQEDFNFTPNEQSYLIGIWKDRSSAKYGRIAGAMAVYESQKKELVGFLRRLLP